MRIYIYTYIYVANYLPRVPHPSDDSSTASLLPSCPSPAGLIYGLWWERPCLATYRKLRGQGFCALRRDDWRVPCLVWPWAPPATRISLGMGQLSENCCSCLIPRPFSSRFAWLLRLPLLLCRWMPTRTLFHLSLLAQSVTRHLLRVHRQLLSVRFSSFLGFSMHVAPPPEAHAQYLTPALYTIVTFFIATSLRKLRFQIWIQRIKRALSTAFFFRYLNFSPLDPLLPFMAPFEPLLSSPKHATACLVATLSIDMTFSVAKHLY